MVLTLTDGEVILRVLAALAAGFALGLEREGHGRAAGLKTMVLACVASCLAMVLSESFYLESTSRAVGFLPDRSRLAAGILTGIGFLGAGAILRNGKSIRGVTTGAVLWYATILGMACGSGRFQLAGLGVLIALGVLYLLPKMENKLKRDGFARLVIAMDFQKNGEEAFASLLKEQAIVVTDMHRGVDLKAGEKVLEYQIKFRFARDRDLSKIVVDKLVEAPGVRRVHWE